ncbi:unnamed protein product [Paramecium sonneborni]|uniref:Protein kinase domain-containing protein n=1 Tax=Paramecium sonneborni TaxID=65129 RepID=A0A8S1RG40_9CILI|nr:unnamed protein product [Paramecium sonneborni]
MNYIFQQNKINTYFNFNRNRFNLEEKKNCKMQNNWNFGKIMIEGVTYQRLGRLGEGTEGTVYKGENIQTKEIVAIKEYKTINSHELEAIKKIRQSNFSHIVGIKGFQNYQNKCPIIVMEFADGEFYKYMQTNDYSKLDYQQKIKYFLQMVQGVSQLHQLELFHRDLKPENFVYINLPNKQKIIKLIDFGLVKENANKLAKTCCVGTPYYIAPEVLQTNFNQRAFYDKSVDIWSLGIIWYEMLVGKTFFNGTQTSEILHQIQNKSQLEIDKQIQLNPIIQQKEKDLIKEMLKKNSIQRSKLDKIIQSYNQQQNQDEQKINNLKVQAQFNNPTQQHVLNDRELLNQQIKLDSEENERLTKEKEELNKKLQRIQEETKRTMMEEYEQKLCDFELKKEEEMQFIKKQIEKQKDQELSEKLEQVKIIQKNQFEIQIKEKEEQLKNQQENALKQQQDKELLAQMKLQQEIEFQNEMDQFKKSKEEEQKYQLQQYIDEANQKKEQEIIQILQEQEKQIKQQIELDVETKYMLEYSKIITELENKQNQENQQQLQDKKQLLSILLQSHQNTIKMFIYNLEQQLQTIKNIDLSADKKDKLIQNINSQLQSNMIKLQKNEQKQLCIQQVSKQEQLRGLDNQLTLELQQDLQDQNNINQIVFEQQMILQKQVGDKQKLDQQKKEEQKLQVQEQQLNIEKKNFFNNFQKLKQQSDSYSGNIKKIQERMNFYERISYSIKDQEKFQQVVGHYSKLIQELLVLEQQEKTLNFIEKSQKLINYQSVKIKLEELLLSQNRIKIFIDETNQYLEKIDSKFLEEKQRQIDDLAQYLLDQQDKFIYLSQNKKYHEKINLINNQIRNYFEQLKGLSSLLNQELFDNYQNFKNTTEYLSQQLQVLQRQHNLILEQVHNDQQIEQRNAERIKKIKAIEGQLNEFIDKMNHLKVQVCEFSKNQFCNNETRTLIMDKQLKIDQNAYLIQQQYQDFQRFNELTSCEAINVQIIYLEQFQEKLKQQLLNEQEKVNQLHLVIQKISNENKSDQEKEYFQLKNQLQQIYLQFSKAFLSVKIDQDKIAYLEQINEKREFIKKQLELEIQAIDNYQEIYKDNQKLNEELITIMKGKQQEFFNNIPVQLYKLQDLNQKKNQKLIEVQQIVHNKLHELKFMPLDNSLFTTYKYLYQQDQLIQQKITEICQMEQNQQQNPQPFSELKQVIQTVTYQLNELIQKIPQIDKVQQFNNIYKNSLESCEKLYTQINYIKMYHLTRYYERINENANKQKNNLKENSQNLAFQQKLNEEIEENTQKEIEAQNLFKIYENIILHQFDKKMIEELQKDYEQISKQNKELEALIQSKNLVKLRSSIKSQNNINDIKQYYKIAELAQILELNIIRKIN